MTICRLSLNSRPGLIIPSFSESKIQDITETRTWTKISNQKIAKSKITKELNSVTNCPKYNRRVYWGKFGFNLGRILSFSGAQKLRSCSWRQKPPPWTCIWPRLAFVRRPHAPVSISPDVFTPPGSTSPDVYSVQGVEHWQDSPPCQRFLQVKSCRPKLVQSRSEVVLKRIHLRSVTLLKRRS